jgi:hypothetical protein
MKLVDVTEHVPVEGPYRRSEGNSDLHLKAILVGGEPDDFCVGRENGAEMVAGNFLL